MIDLIVRIGVESWQVLVEVSPYVLFGFFVAGVLKGFVPDSYMARHLGRDSLGSVLKAAVIGVPLPLCSCGVLPTALGLRRQGASKGATTAFMIATPETGVDSMAVTYALIDPLMTVIRPVAASLTAVFAGVLVNVFPGKEEAPPLAVAAEGCGGGCCCSHGGGVGLDESAGGGCCEAAGKPGFIAKFRMGMEHAFGEMIADIGRWLIIGVVIAGIISALVPADALSGNMGSGFLSYLAMLVIALPLYVCATASTPIAASLLLKGLSPGAALVFLLAGPATNMATITVMLKTLGKRAAGLYVLSIVIASLGLAWATDHLYAALGLDISAVVAEVDELLPHWVGVAGAVILLALVARSYFTRGSQS